MLYVVDHQTLSWTFLFSYYKIIILNINTCHLDMDHYIMNSKESLMSLHNIVIKIWYLGQNGEKVLKLLYFSFLF